MFGNAGIFFFLSVCLSVYLSKGPNTKSSANRFPEQKNKTKATKNPILQHHIEELTKNKQANKLTPFKGKEKKVLRPSLKNPDRERRNATRRWEKNTAAEQDSSAAATDANTTPEQKEREDGQTEGRSRRTDGRPQSVRPSVRHIAVGGHVP